MVFFTLPVNPEGGAHPEEHEVFMVLSEVVRGAEERGLDEGSVFEKRRIFSANEEEASFRSFFFPEFSCFKELRYFVINFFGRGGKVLVELFSAGGVTEN